MYQVVPKKMNAIEKSTGHDATLEYLANGDLPK
jgi:hypothetical protein